MKEKSNQQITIGDIARLAKVSKTTVSRYLNKKYEYMSDETKEKIEEIISKYDYTPSSVARSLKTKNTNLVAFVVSDIENAFAAPVIKSMNQAFLNTRFHMIVCSSDNSEEQELKLIESLIEQRVEAVFLNPVSYNSTLIKKFEGKLPIILIDRGIRDSKFDFVASDNETSIQSLTEHLYQTGFSSMHLFTEIYQNVEPRFRRVDKFKTMLKKFGLELNHIDNSINVINPFDTVDIEEKILKILKNTKEIPVIIATNGKTLLNTALAIKNLNLNIPHQIGLAGYDDFGANSANGWTNISTTSITSLSPNWKELGEVAVDVLLKRLEKPNEAQKNIKTTISLIIRDSTKRNSKLS